jgi:hypothetical protein
MHNYELKQSKKQEQNLSTLLETAIMVEKKAMLCNIQSLDPKPRLHNKHPNYVHARVDGRY